jgi:outer membrane protein assembly factor BamB
MRGRYHLPLALGAIFILILSSLLIAGSFITHNPTHAVGSSSDWTTYLYSPEHTGYNSAETSINPTTAPNVKLLWTATAGGIISTQPVIANGMIYWGSWDGIEHAANLNGTQAWATNLGQTPTPSGCGGRTHGVLGTATIATVTINGTPTPVLFVGGGSDIFYALNATTGAIIWHTQLASPPYEIWGSPDFYNSSVYIATSSWGDCPLVQSQVFKLDASTGAIQNTFNVVPNGCVGASVWGSVTIDTSNGTLYFATGNGGSCSQSETNAEAVVELNASNLSFVGSWQVPPSQQVSDGDFGDTPTIFTTTIGGTLHRLVGVANKNGIYYALDEANISQGPVWQDTIAVGGSGPEGGQGSISPSAWDGTNLYIAGGNTTIGSQNCQGGLRAVNPATGAFTWQSCLTDGPVLGAVSAVPGVVAVGEGNAIVLLAASDGHTLFKKWDTSSTSNKYYGGPAIANGVVYIGNEDGNFYAYGLTSPPTPTPTSPTPTLPPGTTLAQDTFQRANQTFWGTASDGHTWGGDANSQSVFSISNNTGQVSNGNNIYNAVLGSSATDSEVLFSGSISSFSGSNFGAVLHWSDGNNLYKGYIDGTNLVIQKRVNGTATTLNTTPFAATGGTSYTLRFRIAGTTLYAKAWQTNTTEPSNWMVTATDNSLSSGFCGLRMQIASGITLNVTSFLASVPGGTPTPTPTPTPTTLAQDTFQRANQTFWGTASDGQVWGGNANKLSVFSINNNTGQIANGNANYTALLGPVATDAEVLFSGSMSSFSKTNIGAILRWTDANDWYRAYINGTNLIIQKKVNGVVTALGKVAFAAQAGTSYTLRFRVVGTTLYARVWQTNTTEPSNWMVTVTDSSLTSGSCGLRASLQSSVVADFTSFLATTA